MRSGLAKCLAVCRTSSIHVEDLGPLFVMAAASSAPGRAPVALLLHNFLSAAECENLISYTHEKYISAATQYPPRYRSNDLYDVLDEDMMSALWQRLEPHVPSSLCWPVRNAATSPRSGLVFANWVSHSLNPLLRFSRYSGAQFFRAHLDGHYRPKKDLESLLSVTLYLNSDFDGGRTHFFQDKTLSNLVYAVNPRQGTLALFDHDLWHDGAQLKPLAMNQRPKYILRTDVVYQIQDEKTVKLSCEEQKHRDRRAAEAAKVLALPSSNRLNYSKPTRASPHSLLFHSNYIFKLLVLPDGRLLTAGRDTSIVLSYQGQVVRSMQGHTRSVLSLAYLPNTSLILSGSRDFSMRLWDLESGQSIDVKENAHNGNVITLCPISFKSLIPAYEFFSGGSDGMVKGWRVTNHKLEMMSEVRAHDSWVYHILFSADKNQMWTCSEDGAIKNWLITTQTKELTLLNTWDIGVPVYTLLCLPHERVLAGTETGDIVIITPDSNERIVVSGHTKAVRALLLLDDCTVASGSEDGTVRIFRLNFGGAGEISSVLCALPFHRNFVRTLGMFPNGRIVSGSYDGRVKIWDFDNEEL